MQTEGFLHAEKVNVKLTLAKIFEEINSPDRFQIIHFSTLNCNNACVYCNQHHIGQPKSSIKDYRAIYQLIKRKLKDGVKEISLSAMGGEPTIEYQRLIPFYAEIRDLCKGYGASFIGTMTTNARLLEDPIIAQSLVDAGIKNFQVTLDGPASIHDSQRPGLNGEGTFEDTWAGLLALKALQNDDMNCTIRTNHSKKTISKKVLELHLNLLATHFGGDPRFEIYNHIAADLGVQIDCSMLLPKQVGFKEMSRINKITSEHGLLLKTNVYRPNGRVCYASCKNAIAILPGGKLIKCTTALWEPINHVGHLTPEGILKLNSNFQKWVDIESLNRKKCRTCQVAPICQGRSCPLKYNLAGSNPCPDVKFDTKFMFRQLANQEILHNQVYGQ